MRKIISAALITAAVAQPALARNTRDAANRKDVAQAQSDADNMSSIEAGWLRSRVLLAELVLAELHGNQYLMDKIGADHSRNIKTISLGVLRAGLPLAAGAATIYYHNKEQFLNWDEEVRQTYEVVAENRRKISGLKTQAKADLGKADKTEVEIARNTEITALENSIKTDLENVAVTEAKRPWYVRGQKPVRVYFGPVVGAALLIDGATAFAQLVVDPAYGDDVEARLTRFVEDANDTLARR